MSTKESDYNSKSSPRSRRVLKVAIELVLMVAIFTALFWYIGVASLYNALLHINVGYLLLAFLMYFGINLVFTIRLRKVLSKNNVKTTFGKTLLAQYAGMLTSDVTPGRSGYILTPVYLSDQNVPASKGISSVLGIQTIEFLIKVIGGIGAVAFLTKVVPAGNWPSTTFIGVNVTFFVMGLGIALMLTGAILLAAISWSERAISIFDRIANSKYLKRFTGGLLGKLEEYKDSSQKTRSAIPEIFGLSLVCWFIKGFEWYFLAAALGISISNNFAIAWLGFFLIHPLVTALAFVPITPAGAGIQEFGIVGILSLLFVSPSPALLGAILAFAVLARGLLVVEDLAGVPQIVKTTSIIFSRKKSREPLASTPEAPTVNPN